MTKIPPPTTGGEGIMFCSGPSVVHPTLNTYFRLTRYLCTQREEGFQRILSQIFSMWVGIAEGFHGQRLRVTVAARSNALLRRQRRHPFRLFSRRNAAPYTDDAVGLSPYRSWARAWNQNKNFNIKQVRAVNAQNDIKPVASLGWVSPGTATEGVTPIFPEKKTGDLF